jgi:hypothetical protein
MHIITVCPRCNEDFMYHALDSHLFRDETIVDEVGNNEVVETVICQDCCQKEVEKIIEGSKKEVYLVNANEVVDTRNSLLIDEAGQWDSPRPKIYSEKEIRKSLLDIILINPAHISLLKSGYGQFPDTFELTEKGVDYIIEQFKKK